MKILSLLTLMLFQTYKTFVHLRNTNQDIFDEIHRQQENYPGKEQVHFHNVLKVLYFRALIL